MNHSTLLQNPFSLDYPSTSDGDYAGSQQFSSSTGFPTDEEENNRRVSGLGHSLGQPVSMPVSNGLRYSTQQPAMQDVPFAASPTILMSPADSCSETFSQASGSVYSHPAGLQYDRMQDFRSRVPALQPPTGMSLAMQSPTTAVATAPSILGRGDNYSPTFTLGRSSFPSLARLNDMSRYTQYTSTPRTLESSADRSQNLMFGHAGNMLIEPVQRLPQSFTDAPPFRETNVLHSIVSGSQTINPEIHAKIQKGFFEADGKWTCYRRNYLTVACSFTLRPWAPNAPLFIKFADQGTERILSFSMSISAIVNEQYGETRELVQHTPKRDKQSERKPPKVTLQPSQPPPLVLSHGSVSTSGHLGYGLTSHSTGLTMDYNSSYTSAPQPSQPPTQHTFERIQFQKATANNGKRRAQQQYYNLVVELHAEIATGGGGTRSVKIATRHSYPMVVRGRSPGHYKDGRRDNSTNMGPDGANGTSGDGGRATLLPPGIAQATRSRLALMYDSSHRGASHYGRHDYPQIVKTEASPLSGSPLMSSSSSSGFDFATISMDPIDTMKNASSMDSYQESTFAAASPDCRKTEAQTPYRNQPFEYGSPAKDNEDSGGNFPDTFDPMMPMIQNDQDDASHFTKQPPRLPSYHHHQPTTSGYDPIFPSRSTDSNSFGRFDPIQNSQSLCT